MEYQGSGWKSNAGISQLTTPVTRHDWSGSYGADSKIVLHQVTEGASNTLTADFPSQKIVAVPVNASGDSTKTTIRFDIPSHPATFEAR